MRSAAKQSSGDPIERLVLLGRIYVEFAAKDPLQFRLMHRPELFGASGNSSIAASAASAFAVLREASICAIRRGSSEPETLTGTLSAVGAPCMGWRRYGWMEGSREKSVAGGLGRAGGESLRHGTDGCVDPRHSVNLVSFSP